MRIEKINTLRIMGPERSLSAKGKCGKARIKHGERLSV